MIVVGGFAVPTACESNKYNTLKNKLYIRITYSGINLECNVEKVYFYVYLDGFDCVRDFL